LEACGGAVERVPGQAAHRCVNKNSFAQLKRKFYHFVSKHAFDIDGCGPKVIDQLLGAQLIASFPDIFTLKRGDLLNLPRFAEKSVDNLLAAIEQSRKVSLARFLVALSIGQVGEETAEDLANHFKTIEKIAVAGLEELEKIEGVGGVVAASVYDWFRQPENKKLLRELLREVKIAKVVVSEAAPRPLKGQSFVLTGTLASMSRDEAKAAIKRLGGEVSSAVSKQTTYLVAGAGPGSKYDKALSLGVAVLDEAQFQKLLK
jgi:DNA ligase (NAD+)